jgi:hypothetical protein
MRSRVFEVNLLRAAEGFFLSLPSEEVFQALRDKLHETSFNDDVRKSVEAAYEIPSGNRLKQKTAGLKAGAKLC